jgi:hypothetical protein
MRSRADSPGKASAPSPLVASSGVLAQAIWAGTVWSKVPRGVAGENVIDAGQSVAVKPKSPDLWQKAWRRRILTP